MTVEHLKWIQKRIIYLLYVAMFLKLIGEFVPVLGGVVFRYRVVYVGF